MNYRNPIIQAGILVIISSLIGIVGNAASSNSIPLLAKKLEQASELELSSQDPVLLTISLEQAKSFFEKDILFLDARDEVYYEQGHIKGAMKNIFLMELIFNIESIQSKSVPLVVYCGDPGCGDSEDLAYDLQDYGFKKLYVFKGGWLEWSASGYPSEDRN
ncbi:MAG: rhodanese-like domain-containing protein [Candidatus Neomarinimicrobiota bacterium]|nr:rhodanese-like domain-containing protein [Candidatus Neomarinimicrobiota bacterium]